MKYSKATDNALHTMVYLMTLPEGDMIGVQSLAETQRLSPTYLSKILTKLAKAGLVESTRGVKGGYRVSKPKDNITFLDVIKAIEGDSSLFSCSINHNQGCMIEDVMIKAEQNMKDELEHNYLIDIVSKMEEKHMHKNK
ncbi:MAG: Rrf2 family transcriptional regulator [Carnobacterium sp.]|uniref:RrF2 family transcriptional regulator n=1 Tax=Carnobacterium antarcticum TaxID=2126436 RepID=A0ABW4NMR5_9LACT|nr:MULTISPECIES: Rrf2 family transcriptional regulator [unclassified Carnobacterium]ALV22189.1 Rrf2 family transcriptional regulator [Carnobacterium sp. CP1]QQP70110.1 Rrf2 family transcriptional regulator [Carnobacterium sp. CS13]